MSKEAECISNCDIEDELPLPIEYKNRNSLVLAWQDFLTGLQCYRVWVMLAYQDIKLRYRRSVLGPFWITISMAATVYSIGFLYARLFRTDIKEYYPFLVTGMLAWSFISNAITDLVDTFIQYESLIKQIKLPYTLYIHRVLTRNIIVFFHNIIVMIPIYIFFAESTQINLYFLLLIPGLLMIYVLTFVWGLILAMLGARYRDITQIVKSLIQIVFFTTPVMWNPRILSEEIRHLIYLNPFYSFLELIRAPLIGKPPDWFNIQVTLICTMIGFLIAGKIFINYRQRIVYWL